MGGKMSDDEDENIPLLLVKEKQQQQSSRRRNENSIRRYKDEFVSQVSEYKRMLDWKRTHTPKTFLREFGEYDSTCDDLENSCTMKDVDQASDERDDTLQCSLCTVDSGLGQSQSQSQVQTQTQTQEQDNELPMVFDRMGIGNKVPLKSPSPPSPLITFGSQCWTPVRQHNGLSPKTPASAVSGSPPVSPLNLNTPQRRALMESPNQSPNPASAGAKPLFRLSCSNLRVGKRLQNPTQPQAKPFRMSCSNQVVKRPTGTPGFQGNVQQRPLATQATPQVNVQQLMGSFYKAEKKVRAYKKSNRIMKSKLALSEYRGRNGDFVQPNVTELVSDTVYRMMTSAGVQPSTSRTQIIIQDPMTVVQLKTLANEIRAKKRDCDCLCFCDEDTTGVSLPKKLMTSGMPPLSQEHLDKLKSLNSG